MCNNTKWGWKTIIYAAKELERGRNLNRITHSYIVRHVVDRCNSRVIFDSLSRWVYISIKSKWLRWMDEIFHCRSWLLTSRRDKHWRSSTMVAECGEEKNQQQASSTWNGIEKWFLNDESSGESVRVFNFTPINRRCIIWICWRKKQQHRRQKLIKLKRSHFWRVAFSSCRFKQNTNKTKKKEKVHHRIRTVFFLGECP